MSAQFSTALLKSEQVAQSRELEQVIKGMPTSDGAGVKLTRLLLPAQQQRLDPFLMLDAFASDNADDYLAGFPDHPHRGFETITYMLQGKMRHHDSAGNSGLLESGGMQWMNAGRGVIHSELPEQEQGLMAGFQLWLNLPASEKMSMPWYRDIPAAAIPEFQTESGVQVKVLAGRSHGIDGAQQRPHTAPLYLDLHLSAGAEFSQTLAMTMNAFVVVYQGELEIAGSRISATNLGILTNQGDGVSLRALTESRVLLIAGQPLHEAIVQYGPFVMNTEQQIRQAIFDFRSGQLA